MSDRSNLVYVYDGSFEGLLCCVFESYTNRQLPINILPADFEQNFLYEEKIIETDNEKFNRIYTSLTKLGKDTIYLVKVAFLFGMDCKDFIIFQFILLCYKYKRQTVNMLTNEIVSQMHQMVKSVNNEQHLLLGFVRFSEYNGNLVSVIEPKHFVLPLIKGHFCARFPNEHFMIYDKTHGVALVYKPYKAIMIPVDSLQLPSSDIVEEGYRELWRQYFNTIAIQERVNPRCQMTHMPKRFWGRLTEMQNGATKTPISNNDRCQLN